MNKKKKYSVIFLVCLCALGYFWYSRTQNASTEVKYVTEKVAKNTLTTAISGSGNIIVDTLATVDPTISGTVANVAVNVGDNVKKGEILFTIINEDLEASALQSSVSLQNAKVNLNQAKTNLINARNGGSETERERNILKEKIVIAEQNVRVAEVNYQNALTDSRKRQVASPIDGTVNAINIKNGDDLSRLSGKSTSEAPMIIGDLRTLKAEVIVNEVDIANVSLGQKATLTLSAFDGMNLSGTVEKMDALGTITQGVVNYTVTIGLDTMDERLRPGMSVSAKIITEVKENIVTVPNSALKMKKNRTYVEILDSKTKLPVERSIEIGSANTTDTEIVSGISIGEDVITKTIDPNAKTTTKTTGSGLRIPGIGGRG